MTDRPTPYNWTVQRAFEYAGPALVVGDPVFLTEEPAKNGRGYLVAAVVPNKGRIGYMPFYEGLDARTYANRHQFSFVIGSFERVKWSRGTFQAPVVVDSGGMRRREEALTAVLDAAREVIANPPSEESHARAIRAVERASRDCPSYLLEQVAQVTRDLRDRYTLLREIAVYLDRARRDTLSATTARALAGINEAIDRRILGVDLPLYLRSLIAALRGQIRDRRTELEEEARRDSTVHVVVTANPWESEREFNLRMNETLRRLSASFSFGVTLHPPRGRDNTNRLLARFSARRSEVSIVELNRAVDHCLGTAPAPEANPGPAAPARPTTRVDVAVPTRRLVL